MPWADSWNDQWPFVASGVPAFTLSAAPRGYDSTIYHTPADTPTLIDWSYFRSMNLIEYHLATQLDDGLLPYDLGVRADDLCANVSAGALTGAGVPASIVNRLTADVSAFEAAADSYMARRSSIPPSRQTTVNAGLLAVEKEICANLTALDVWEGTIYPHQQVLLDVQSLSAALVEIAKVQPNPVRATKALGNVSQTWYGPYFSPEVYAWELARHQPDSPNLYFGGLGHVPRLWNVMPQYRQIEAGHFAEAKAGLQPMHDAALADLNVRLKAMCEVLERVTPMIDGLR